MSPRRPTLTIRVVMARRYARTIHCTSWKRAVNAWASVGKATFAMLVSSEGISMDSERLAIARRIGVGFNMDKA